MFSYVLPSWSTYQGWRSGTALAGLTPSHFWVCPKPEPGFSMPHLLLVFFVQWVQLRREVIVSLLILVKLMTIIFFNFLFIISIKWKESSVVYLYYIYLETFLAITDIAVIRKYIQNKNILSGWNFICYIFIGMTVALLF